MSRFPFRARELVFAERSREHPPLDRLTRHPSADRRDVRSLVWLVIGRVAARVTMATWTPPLVVSLAIPALYPYSPSDRSTTANSPKSALIPSVHPAAALIRPTYPQLDIRSDVRQI
jgi:hypothetical protein